MTTKTTNTCKIHFVICIRIIAAEHVYGRIQRYESINPSGNTLGDFIGYIAAK